MKARPFMRLPPALALWQAFRPARLSLAAGTIALLVGLLVSAGCSPKSTQAAAPAAPPAWSWAAYPAVEKMRLAVLPCRVQPKTSLTINAPLAGTLRLYVDRPQTNLPVGFLFAEFEPKLLAAESNALADAKQKLAERE